MTEDQRFAAQRPDVLVYQGDALDADVVVAGPVKVHLTVSTTGTDSDFVVKLIDVYPNDYPTPVPAKDAAVAANAAKMGGYEQLVRGEPFRGKYRNSLEKPEPFVPGAPATIDYELPDVYHAFRRGHRIGAGAELVVPACRPQSAMVHGDSESPQRRLSEGHAACVPISRAAVVDHGPG
jgi:uncharacterized protein